MTHEKLRRQILHETMRLLLTQQESDIGRAKIRAARKLVKGWVKPRDMPSDQEIRGELQRMTATAPAPPAPDRFDLFHRLLSPLERVSQSRWSHPEGDVLYHSLQVFTLARDAKPYDEEFLLAALLHDVGKGLDPLHHVDSALRALGDAVSERTAWLIANHADAQRIHDGTIGQRARRRLSASEDYDDLLLLAACDREGRAPGAAVPDLDEALDYLRDLEEQDESE